MKQHQLPPSPFRKRRIFSAQTGLQVLTAVIALLSPLVPGVTAAQTARTQTAVVRVAEANIRADSTTRSTIRCRAFGGNPIQISDPISTEGAVWYRALLPLSGCKGWIRSDLVQPIAQANRNLATTAGQFQVARVEPTSGTNEALSYFLEIALGSEFGQARSGIRKWQDKIIIRVNGTPNLEDQAALRQVIQDINLELAQVEGLNSAVSLTWDNNHPSPNLQIYFVPESQFRRYEPNYRPRNLGFFWTWPDTQGVIRRARVMVSTTGVTQRERNHLIREELTQSLGLMNDSWRYQDSIFYQGWTDPNDYAPIDRKLIQFLYNPALQPGMGRQAVVATLNQNFSPAAASGPVQLEPALSKPPELVFPKMTSPDSSQP